MIRQADSNICRFMCRDRQPRLSSDILFVSFDQEGHVANLPSWIGRHYPFLIHLVFLYPLFVLVHMGNLR
jgi:hypothetical protein